MHVTPNTPVTTNVSTLAVVATAVLGLGVWLWQMKWTQDRLGEDLAELRTDMKWLQRTLVGHTRDDTAAVKVTIP